MYTPPDLSTPLSPSPKRHANHHGGDVTHIFFFSFLKLSWILFVTGNAPPPQKKKVIPSQKLACGRNLQVAVLGSKVSTYQLLRYSVNAPLLPCGQTVLVRREPAIGAIVLQRMLFFWPSRANVLDRPSKPSLAAHGSRKQNETKRKVRP